MFITRAARFFVLALLTSVTHYAAAIAPNPPVLLGPGLGGSASATSMRWVPPVPADPCETAVNDLGLVCGDGKLHCPTDLASARAALQNTNNTGDYVCLRGGTYRSPGGSTPMFNITTNGLSIGEYPGETVILQGRDPQVARAEYNAGNNADRNHNGMQISADNITVQGLRFEWFGETAITARGNNLRIIDNDFQYAYKQMVLIGYGDCCDESSPSFSNVEVMFNRFRHSVGVTGINLGPELKPKGHQRINDVKVKYNISYRMGYLPNEQVEPNGGGNADAYGSFKSCADAVNEGSGSTYFQFATDNYCHDWDFAYNLGQYMTDGHLDFSAGRVRAVGNALIDPGPTDGHVVGIKFLRSSVGTKTVGNNLIHGANHMFTGLEARNESQTINVINNQFMHGTSHMLLFNAGGGDVANNVVSEMGGNFSDTGGATVSNNFNNESGIPGISDCGATKTFNFIGPMSNESISARDRLVSIYSDIAQSCGPSANSNLIDKGKYVAGYHCARADDDANNPYPANDENCVHWLGNAPDQGPFERGLFD